MWGKWGEEAQVCRYVVRGGEGRCTALDDTGFLPL